MKRNIWLFQIIFNPNFILTGNEAMEIVSGFLIFYNLWADLKLNFKSVQIEKRINTKAVEK